MIPSARYAFAVLINVALPTVFYRIALPHYGLIGALIASTVPLLAWIIVDFVRFRHFDALSAVVLAGVAMSLLALMFRLGKSLDDVREPLVSAFIGIFFILSLLSRKPLVFYLARSTLARERQGFENEFDVSWRTRPALIRSIRLMTAVWGTGLICENAIRIVIANCMDSENSHQLAAVVKYASYGALTLWTIAYRRVFIKRQ